MSDSVRPHRRQPTRLPRPWDSPGKNTGVGCHFLLQCVKSESEVAQSCLTHSDPMDCSPPGSSIHGIFQARVLEWGAIAFSGIRVLHTSKGRQGLSPGLRWERGWSCNCSWSQNGPQMGLGLNLYYLGGLRKSPAQKFILSIITWYLTDKPQTGAQNPNVQSTQGYKLFWTWIKRETEELYSRMSEMGLSNSFSR